MFHRRTLLMAGLATLAAPGIAHANSVSQEIDISSTVAGACGMGNPGQEEINVGDMTDADGLLDSRLRGAMVDDNYVVIPNAWCNTPHKLTMAMTPMTLQDPPPYAQPSYMARDVTYTASLKNWAPAPAGPMTLRVHGPSGETSSTYLSALAARNDGLTLEISQLAALNQSYGENQNLMLEVGSYKGTVTITLATNP